MKPLLTILFALSCLSGWGQIISEQDEQKMRKAGASVYDIMLAKKMNDNDKALLDFITNISQEILRTIVSTSTSQRTGTSMGIIEIGGGKGMDDPITYESLLSDWQSYKDECYADSTIKKVTIPCPCYPCAAYCFKTEIIHRPPTFEGFMEYLERKYKPTNN